MAHFTSHIDGWGGWDGKLVKYELPGCAQPKAVRELVEAALVPAQRKDVAPLLAALAEGMPAQGDRTRAESWMQLVWMAINDFPLDIILVAAENLVKREHWRPSPAQLREECFRVGDRRMALKAMLKDLPDE